MCRVCTLCFAIRAVLLMTRTTLGPVWEDVYFLLAEVRHLCEAGPPIYLI